MQVGEVQAEADRLGLELSEPSADALKRSIERELLGLQTAELTDEETSRRLALTDALARMHSAARPRSTELVTLTADALAELVKAAIGATQNGPTSEEKMRKGAQVAATQARKDFRNSRSLPFAGFSAVVVFVWSQRTTFGVDLTSVGQLSFIVGGICAIVFAAVIYMNAWLSNTLDGQKLRNLYAPEAQARALAIMQSAGPDFTIEDYRGYLSQVVGIRRGRPRPLSTVDLRSALDDAAELAIERFIALGVVAAVESWSGLDYVLTEKIFGPANTPADDAQ